MACKSLILGCTLVTTMLDQADMARLAQICLLHLRSIRQLLSLLRAHCLNYLRSPILAFKAICPLSRSSKILRPGEANCSTDIWLERREVS